MTITVTRLAPSFVAQVDGVDITRPVDDATWARIRAAFEEHSVLVFRGRPLDDDTQIAFSRRFGSLEVTRSMNPAAGTPFARQSNLDIKTGAVIPPDDRRMVYQLANMLEGRRSGRLGQPLHSPPRDAIRYRALPAAHAADDGVGERGRACARWRVDGAPAVTRVAPRRAPRRPHAARG